MSDAQTPELKAAGVNSLLAVLQTMVGRERYLAWARTLPAATSSLIHQPRLAQEWIALETIAPLYPSALHDLFAGDTERLYELGRQQLRNDMSGIYRVFMRVASPGYVADKTAAIYAVYARGCGTLSVVARTDNSLEFLLDHRPFPSLAFFESLRGSIAGALELTGIKDLKVVALDAARADQCRLRATWT